MRLNLKEGVILRWGKGAFESRGGGLAHLEEGIILCWGRGGGVRFDLATEWNNVGVAHFCACVNR